MALSDELLVASLDEESAADGAGADAAECALAALSLLQRLMIYTSKLAPAEQLLARVASLLEHPAPVVRRRAVGVLRQVMGTCEGEAGGPPVLRGLEKKLVRLMDMDVDPEVQEEVRALASWVLLPPSARMAPMQAFDLLHHIVAGKHSGASLFPEAAPPARVWSVWTASVVGPSEAGVADGEGAAGQRGREGGRERGGVAGGKGDGGDRGGGNDEDDVSAGWGDEDEQRVAGRGTGEGQEVAYQPRYMILSLYTDIDIDIDIITGRAGTEVAYQPRYMILSLSWSPLG